MVRRCIQRELILIMAAQMIWQLVVLKIHETMLNERMKD